MMTNPAPDERYARHFALPDFGRQEQQKLRAARVLVVGAGGGSPLLYYLAAAGLGKIGRELNPEVEIEVFPFRLSANNALDLMAQYDCVADGSDNFPTRYLVNDACVMLGKPNVYASVFRYEGQVSVFNMPREDGSRGPNYRDLYPEIPPAESIPNCSEAGVLGTLTGIIGSIQANETIKLITGIGELLDARLFMLDSRSMQTQILRLPKTSHTPIIQLAEDYGRTSRERLSGHLGGTHIPLDQLLAQCEGLDKQKTWIVYCHSGIRSATATRWMLDRGFKDVYNLKGGMVQAMRHKKNTS